MKIVTFEAGGQTRWGALHGDAVVDLNLARAMYLASHGKEAKYLATDVLDFIRQGEDAWDAAEETLEFFGGRVVDGISFPRDAAKLLAPLPNPSKVIGIGLNYGEHRREQQVLDATNLYPILFPKFPNAIIASGEAIAWDPALTQKVDYEAELGVVIGKRAKRVAEADALDYVFGYCNLNDISARDLQFDERTSKQWTRGKSLDTFCPLGPHIVTKDEVADPQNLSIRCWVNGEVRQDSNTRDMINSVAQLIAFISQGITLMPGDLIATGTPSGVGHHRHPPVYLKPGDVVEVEVEGLGRLSNPIKESSQDQG
ncbi:MAG: fumarylacetoacetate hydrolase family protein [Chloroflexota bacterium]|nr:fumarylacetoacetate hydrolase family protein [Chloroflexota bacterium]